MEQSIWMGILPTPSSTRVIAMRGPTETILKAQLRATPQSTQALPRLLEAIAMWEGMAIRAALVVSDDPAMSACPLYGEAFPPPDATPLYRIDTVFGTRPRRRRDPIRGMGDFRALEQLLLFEVAR